MTITDYKHIKLNDLTGVIMKNGEKSYIAVTATKSKTFRSLKGAQKFMEKNEYTLA